MSPKGMTRPKEYVLTDLANMNGNGFLKRVPVPPKRVPAFPIYDNLVDREFYVAEAPVHTGGRGLVMGLARGL